MPRSGRPRSFAPPALMACLATLAAVVLAGCGSTAAAGPSTAAASVPVAGAPASAGPRAATLGGRRAAAALASFNRAFYVPSGATAYYANTTAGAKAEFWRQAELIEMEEDAWQATHDPAVKRQIVALLGSVVTRFSHNWSHRPWNDDIEWMIIAAARAYQITGDRAYLSMAQRNFDLVYARAYSTDFGGGLWWATGGGVRQEKNVVTNATAAIAACELARSTGQSAYLAKAKALYRWLVATLYDPKTGAVWDHVNRSATGAPVTDRASLTYNQGTFIGACDLVQQALHWRAARSNGIKALAYTKTVMAGDGVLPAETGGNGNFPGFKGIFCRWAMKLVRDDGLKEYLPWFRLNAAAAWRHRDARGLMDADWSAQTGSGELNCWGCSSAVVLLQELATR